MVSVGPLWMMLHTLDLLGLRFLVCKTDLGRTVQCICVCLSVYACTHVYLSSSVWGWSECEEGCWSRNRLEAGLERHLEKGDILGGERWLIDPVLSHLPIPSAELEKDAGEKDLGTLSPEVRSTQFDLAAMSESSIDHLPAAVACPARSWEGRSWEG